jgi:hypothetical protein
MSDRKPEVIKVTNKGKSMVEAKKHTSNDGSKSIIVITAEGPGESDAILHIGKPGLKSRFGHLTDLGDGNYGFKATNVASDLIDL